jgi:hypothetical protein
MQVHYLNLVAQGRSAEAAIVQTGERIDSVATPFELISLFRDLRLT